MISYRNLKNKIVFYLLLIFLITSIMSCPSRDEVSEPTGSGVMGDIVSFSINSQLEVNSIYVYFKPNIDVRIAIVTCRAPSYVVTVILNSATTYSKERWHYLEKFDFFASGENWSFNFEGIIIEGGSDFDVTTNYTIP